LVEAAMDSDAVNGGMARPTIKLHRNGEYSADRSFRESVMQPFISGFTRSEFLSAAESYDELYNSYAASESASVATTYLPNTLVDAFSAEFGLTPYDAANCCAGLISLAAKEEDVIVSTTLASVRAELVENQSI